MRRWAEDIIPLGKPERHDKLVVVKQVLIVIPTYCHAHIFIKF